MRLYYFHLTIVITRTQNTNGVQDFGWQPSFYYWSSSSFFLFSFLKTNLQSVFFFFSFLSPQDKPTTSLHQWSSHPPHSFKIGIPTTPPIIVYEVCFADKKMIFYCTFLLTALPVHQDSMKFLLSYFLIKSKRVFLYIASGTNLFCHN